MFKQGLNIACIHFENDVLKLTHKFSVIFVIKYLLLWLHLTACKKDYACSSSLCDIKQLHTYCNTL